MKAIRELRGSVHMTQQAFSDLFGIPVSTLRKWEQGEASPPDYVVRLIARALPGENATLREYKGENGEKYYYNRGRRSVLDQRGNEIFIQEDLENIKEQNLKIYLGDLFSDYYRIQAKFNRDCYYDKQEGILWTRE